VLHLNPRPGNDDESKMRGHLGTELGNKVTDTIASIKHKDGNGVTFTVKQLDARGKDLDDWKFEVTDQAGALGIPRIIAGGSSLDQVRDGIENDKRIMEQETVRILKTIILPPNTEYFTNIIKKLKDQLRVGETKAKGYFNALRESHPALMYQTSGGQWTLSKKELEAYEQGLPFASEP
jgi:hypothetical protein